MAPRSPRLEFLDACRAFAVLGMLLANMMNVFLHRVPGMLGHNQGDVLRFFAFPAALLWWRFYTFYIYIALGAIIAGGVALRAVRKTDEMEEELRAHLQLRADDLERSGLTRADAERQARIEFGGQERFKEESYEAHGNPPGKITRHGFHRTTGRSRVGFRFAPFRCAHCLQEV